MRGEFAALVMVFLRRITEVSTSLTLVTRVDCRLQHVAIFLVRGIGYQPLPLFVRAPEMIDRS